MVFVSVFVVALLIAGIFTAFKEGSSDMFFSTILCALIIFGVSCAIMESVESSRIIREGRAGCKAGNAALCREGIEETKRDSEKELFMILYKEKTGRELTYR